MNQVAVRFVGDLVIEPDYSRECSARNEGSLVISSSEVHERITYVYTGA